MINHGLNIDTCITVFWNGHIGMNGLNFSVVRRQTVLCELIILNISSYRLANFILLPTFTTRACAVGSLLKRGKIVINRHFRVGAKIQRGCQTWSAVCIFIYIAIDAHNCRANSFSISGVGNADRKAACSTQMLQIRNELFAISPKDINKLLVSCDDKSEYKTLVMILSSVSDVF